jgi:hypothetical protein
MTDEILQLITNTDILQLPTDDSINGWVYTNGIQTYSILDGHTDILEYVTSHEYVFKKFSNSEVYGTLSEAILVTSFSNEIDKITNTKDRFEHFLNGLSNGTYYYGSVVLVKSRTKANAKTKRRRR